MRKVLSVIAVLSLLLSFSSAYNVQEIDCKINSFAPNLSISNDDSTFILSKQRGKFVLLNFWSSENAESRIRNIVNCKLTENIDSSKLALLSVNYDANKNLFKEIVNVDNLNEESQFYDSNGIRSEVYKQFHLENGFNSYLINKEGKIVAINPTSQQLTILIRQ